MFVSEQIHSEPQSPVVHREIDVRALWQAIYRRKIIVATSAALFTAFALYLAFTATWIFRSEVTIALVHQSAGGALAGSVGQLGGLASLTGLNLNESGQDQEWMGVLHSRRLVDEFIKRDGVLPLLSRGAKETPTLWQAVETLKKFLIVTEDKANGLITVSFDWTDPATAARWANSFVARANETIRTKAIDDANRNIEYLNQQLAHTSVVELQKVMYNLIEEQTKALMLARGRVEYAFTVVDPAVPPETRFRPKRALMVLTGLALGTFLGSLIAVMYDFARERRRQVVPQSSQ